jgi:hypothetical protein
MSKRRLFEKSRVLAQGSLRWVDQLQHLLGLPDNDFILVSSSLDQRLLEWLLPGVCVFLILSQGGKHYTDRIHRVTSLHVTCVLLYDLVVHLSKNWLRQSAFWERSFSIYNTVSVAQFESQFNFGIRDKVPSSASYKIVISYA